MPESKTVFFFTSVPIAPFGQGSSMRVYTNLRAYLDLGFHVELIYFADDHNQTQPLILPEGKIQLTQVSRRPAEMNRYAKKLAILLGWPKDFLLNALFPVKSQVVSEIRERFHKHPEALFHFEYDDFASAAIDFQGIRAVWSNHDLVSQRAQLIWSSRHERSLPKDSEAQRQRILQRMVYAEYLLAKHVSLILNIAAHENVELLRRGYQNAVLFPMSWPDEALVPRVRPWMECGMLRLLHLGSVNGLVGYESLKFLIGEVFPLLTAKVMESIELWVVGTIADSFYCNRIIEMASSFPQVRFLGYQEELRKLYAQVDLQVVGGRKASGLRTRIIESLVYGVPVLSTSAMAEGLNGLVDGDNILLAQDAQGYADVLSCLTIGHVDFEGLALRARSFYDSSFSRAHAVEVLREALRRI